MRDFVKLKKEYRALSATVMGGLGFGAVAAGAGVSSGIGPGLRTDVFNFVNTPIPLVDNAGVVAYGSLKFADMPEGFINFYACVANLVLTKSSAGVNADWDGDFGVGSVAADSGATLAATEQNIIPTTATPQAVAGVTSAKGSQTLATVQLDGSATPVDLFLNILVDDADHDVTTTPCNIIVNGTIRVTYLQAGDK